MGGRNEKMFDELKNTKTPLAAERHQSGRDTHTKNTNKMRRDFLSPKKIKCGVSNRTRKKNQEKHSRKKDKEKKKQSGSGAGDKRAETRINQSYTDKASSSRGINK